LQFDLPAVIELLGSLSLKFFPNTVKVIEPLLGVLLFEIAETSVMRKIAPDGKDKDAV
jgi:hypothetical protein